MKLFYVFGLMAVLSLTSCGGEKSAEEVTATTEKTASNQQKVQARQVPVKPSAPQSVNAQQAGENLDWLSMEEAMKRNEKDPKPILVDVYTTWCGWCKVMDRKTFTDANVKDYIEKNFYPVKFDAEQKDPITFNGKKYEFVPGGRRGHNQLAAHLLNGRLGYPSFAFLNSDYEHLHITVGYKNPEQFLGEMKKAISQAM